MACSHGVTGWGGENVIGWDLLNVIFLTAFKVTPVGECGLTFSAQSKMSVPEKKKKNGMRGIKSVKEENWGHGTISGLVDMREKPNRSKEKWMQTSITACWKVSVLTELGSRPLTWSLITEQHGTLLYCAEAIVLMSLEEFQNSPVECWPCVSSTIRWHTSHIYFFCGSCPIKALSLSADIWKTIHLHVTVTADFPPSLATPHLLPRPGPRSRTGVSVSYSNRWP